jgi:ligand-binding sensor domain-containing protein/signal transduction histidine kinase
MAFFVRVLLAIVGAAATLSAERLPVKTYTTADGLARNRVQRIVTDSRGLIWIATSEGLSQFDGYRFINYGTRDGLASRVINDLLEARDGAYWVATDEGLCRFHPKMAQHLFTLYHHLDPLYLHSINELVQDSSGAIWAATDAGLYRETNPARSPSEDHPEWIDLGMPRTGDFAAMRAVMLDRQGSLWVGGAGGLFRRYPDGRVESYSTANGLPSTFVETLLEDSQGRIWAGTRLGLCRLASDPSPGRKIVERIYTEEDGLGYRDIKALSLAPDGTIWVGSLSGGLAQIRMGADGRAQIRAYGKPEGLSDETIIALAHDREGNLWVGGESGGLMRIVRSGFLTYTQADGLVDDRPRELFLDHDGDICVVSNNRLGRGSISRLDGAAFHAFSYPIAYKRSGWPVIQDHSAVWWIGAPSGLARLGRFSLSQMPQARAQEVFNGGSAAADFDGIYRMFADSHGAIWVSYQGRRNGVGRWDRARGLQLFPHTNGPIEQLVSAFAEDRDGDIWLGLYGGGIVRYRDGRFTEFGRREGVPDGYISSLYVDEAGRLWIASANGGLGRIDAPVAEHPAVRVYDASHGLSSDSVISITSDQWGRIYVGTGRGLDRLDPATDRIKHYTIADGLANDAPLYSVRDRRGWLWFGTTKGLSRLIPEPDRPRPPPSIRITGLNAAGKPYPISQLGESRLDGVEFPAGDVRIEFSGVNFEAGAVLRYQYRIIGAGSDWSAPGDQRSVNLAGLSPGPYLFQARAVDSQGQVSQEPAAIALRIPPPLWGLLWFRLLCLAAVALLLYQLYRFRLNRMLELEHIRTRIATDLHDDIGASLSQIAILSEVARRPVEAGALDPLGSIGRISRELVESMSDIVWAINPQRDNLLDLTRRMRRFAGEMLVPGAIDFTFDAEEASGLVALGADLRRQVFFIFKECLNNAARHSGASHVDIVFALSGDWLCLTVRDNGCGFDPGHLSDGQGLASMARRAAALHGQFKIESVSGEGTTARLAIPLPRRRMW